MEAEQYKNIGVPEEKIEIIPNGIDMSQYADQPSKGSFKKKFSIKDNGKIVLYLGRIHRIKGIDILVEAFANVLKKLENVKLVVVGPDDGFLGELKQLIKALKVEDDVIMPGPLYGREKLEAYVDADFYVLPSRYETFPMTVLEAVACGKPVILTEKCGVAEYFRNKVGLVVKPDSKHLEEALLELLLNREKRAIFEKNSKTVIEKFTISQIASKLEKVYEELSTMRTGFPLIQTGYSKKS
jgi:glycosyltransferase involved in cell wall biosynthesis